MFQISAFRDFDLQKKEMTFLTYTIDFKTMTAYPSPG